MSKTVDSRVVEMSFDGKKFESGVKGALSSLNQLSTGLKNVDNSKAFSNLGTNVADMAKGVEKLADRFSTWGIVSMQAVSRLTDHFINLLSPALTKVEAQLKNLTIDQVNAGWRKFGEYSESVATIMSATGREVDYVEEQMSRLNYFTDETSYNFTDMAANIGKFTSQGVALEEAVTDMEGIATWAALSGQNAASASRAMYNLSQALGVGAVKLMDWKSIENANMATKEFKETVLEAAVDCGTLTKSLDGMYKTVGKGTEVTISNFSQTLSEGWFDVATLRKVLGEYGNFAQKMNDTYNMLDGRVLTKKILEWVDAFQKGEMTLEDLSEQAKKFGVSADDLKDKIKELASEENALGKKSFEAAQKARTFQAAMDATADAASTVWLNIFKDMFGNVTDATKVWSDFCEFLYTALVEPLNSIEAAFSSFAERSGFKNILSAFGVLGESINQFFQGREEDDYEYGFFTGLEDSVTSALEKVEKFAIRWKTILRQLNETGTFARLGEYIKQIGTAINRLIAPIKQAFGDVFNKKVDDLVAGFDKLVTNLGNFVEEITISDEAMAKIRHTFEGFFTIVKNVASAVWNFAKDILPPLWDVFQKIASIVLEVADGLFGWATDVEDSTNKTSIFAEVLGKVSDILGKVLDKIRNFKLSDAYTKTVVFLTNAFQKLKDVFIQLKEAIGPIDLGRLLLGVGGAAAGVGVGKLAGNLGTLIDKIKSGKLLSGAIDNIKELGETLANYFGKGGKINSSTLKDVAISVGVLAASILILSMIKTDKLVHSLEAIIAAGMSLVVFVALLGKITTSLEGFKSGKVLAAAAAMTLVAAAILLLAAALAAFTLVAKSGFAAIEGLVLMAASLTAVVVALEILAKTCNPGALLAAAAAILVVSVSLTALAVALALFTAVTATGAALNGLLTMAATLAVVAVSLGLLATYCNPVSLIAAAGAILIVSAALVALAAALAAITAVIAIGGTGGLAALVAILGVMAIALLALGAAAPAVLAASAAMLAFSAALLVVAAAIAVGSAALILFAASLAALGVGIVALIGGIAANIALLGVGVASAIKSVGDAIAHVTEEIFASIGEGIGKGISAIGSGFEDLASGITSFGGSIGDVGDGIRRFGDGVKSLQSIKWLDTAAGILELKAAIKQLNNTPINIDISPLNEFVSAVNSTARDVTTAANKIITNFVSAFNSGASRVRSAAQTMSNYAYNGANAYTGYYSGLGTNCVIGFANGISSYTFYAEARAAAMANAAYNAARRALRSHSPSRRFMELGDYVGQGFAIGISDSTADAVKSSTAMSEKVIGATVSAIDKIQDIIDSESDLTIRPVLDLSNVTEGARNLNGMLTSSSSLKLGSSISGVYAANQNGGISSSPTRAIIDSKQLADAIKNGPPQNVDVNVSFEGSLAQLATVLQPYIVAETNRRGPSLIK